MKKMIQFMENIEVNFLSEEQNSNSVKKVMGQLDHLRENGVAYVIKGTEYLGGVYNIQSRVANEMMIKNDPKLKKYIRQPLKYEYGSKEYRTADMDENLVKLAEDQLEFGTYCVQLKDDNYMILETTVSENEDYDDLMIKFTIAFIGKKWRKYRDKYFKKLNKYEAFKSKDMYGYISDLGGRGKNTKVMFKGFDKLIIKDKNSLLEYVDRWIEAIPIYFDKYQQIPKLSILAYGPPGTGKTTLAQAIAKHLSINEIHTVSREYFKEKNERGNIYGSSIIAINDIDCICEKRSTNKKESKDGDADNNNITQKLLAFLDNPPPIQFKTKDGTRYPVSIVIASTNYLDKLDDAVKRPGRFDLILELEHFDEALAREFTALFDLTLEEAVDKKDIPKDFNISPAELQVKCLTKIDLSLKSK